MIVPRCQCRSNPGCTLILEPLMPDGGAVLRGRAGGITVFPLWPDRSDKPASRVLVQAIKGPKAPMRLAQGLVLHEDDGRYTAEAEAVLRHGAPLALYGGRA